jgi:hypothetical protein
MKFWNKIQSACAEISPNCREAVRAQSEALDHPLPPARRFGLWLHLLICKWCRRYGRQIRFLREAAHEHDETLAEGAPQNLSPEARERIKQHLREKK